MRLKLNIGDRFGDLVIIESLGSVKKQTTYKCLCNCGGIRNVFLTHLKSGKVKHCGCKNFLSNHGNRKYDNIESSFRAKASNYKSHANKRGLEYQLTIEETVELLKRDCYYCGKHPKNTYNVRKQNRLNKSMNCYVDKECDGFDALYNGIDRIDNTKGYLINNVVPCCTQCNTAKLTFTINEFKDWIVTVYNKIIKNEI